MDTKKTNIFLAATPLPTTSQKIQAILTQCQEKLSDRFQIQWTHPNDLHITLGYIHNILETDVKRVVDLMSIATLHQSFSVKLTDLKLYGTALAFRVHPIEPLRDIHVELNAQLEQFTQNRYHFDQKGRFEPHITIARLRQHRPLPNQARHELFSLLKPLFNNFEFLLTHVSIMQRNLQENGGHYLNLKTYPFSHG